MSPSFSYSQNGLSPSSCFICPKPVICPAHFSMLPLLYLKSFEEFQRSLLSDISMNISGSAWSQASPPELSGGLWIRSAVQLAPSASSATASLKLVHQILPTSLIQVPNPVFDSAVIQRHYAALPSEPDPFK